LMRRASRPEPIGARMKQRLIQRFQQHQHRPLEDFILQRRDGYRFCRGRRQDFPRS
jgi:hypothetical protein